MYSGKDEFGFAFGKKNSGIHFECPSKFNGIAVFCPTKKILGRVWRHESASNQIDTNKKYCKPMEDEAYWALLPDHAVNHNNCTACFQDMYKKINELIDGEVQLFFDSLTLSSMSSMVEEPLEHTECKMYVCAKKQITAYSLLTAIYAQIQRATDPQQRKNSAENRELIAGRVSRFLNDNLANPPSLNDLAEHFDLSARDVTQSLRQTYGQCFAEHLATLRLTRARRLLETTEKRISGVAYDVGIEPAHLSYAFKKRYGLTPRQARRTIREPVLQRTQ